MFKSILLHPSIQGAAHKVVSIPAVKPILNLPTGVNSFGTVIWAQISGCDVNCCIMCFCKKSHSGLFSINPKAQFPHLCGTILTSYLFDSIIDLTKSLDLAP